MKKEVQKLENIRCNPTKKQTKTLRNKGKNKKMRIKENGKHKNITTRKKM